MQKRTVQAARHRRLGRILLCGLLAAAVLALGGWYLFSEKLEVTFHHLYSPKVVGGENIRVVVLSDLHNREFGPGNAELVERIAALKPDLIAIAGDMVNADDGNLDVILSLCGRLLEIAPVYYSPGNHESNLMYEKGSPLESLLTDLGVHVLVNRAEAVTIHKTPLLIGGLTTSVEGYEEYGAAFFEEYEKSGGFKLLIAHYPSLFYDCLADGAVDLGICGHYHGGQIRLPVVGGLYHGDTGLFPQYSGGLYRLELAHGPGCAAVESLERPVVKELLCAPEDVERGAAACAALCGAPVTARFPSDAADGTPFGAIRWLEGTPASIRSKAGEGWLGLAFD